MSIQSEISRLESAKAGLKSALEEKGVTVPAETTLDGYGALVGQIPTGGGPSMETVTVTVKTPVRPFNFGLHYVDADTLSLVSEAVPGANIRVIHVFKNAICLITLPRNQVVSVQGEIYYFDPCAIADSGSSEVTLFQAATDGTLSYWS